MPAQTRVETSIAALAHFLPKQQDALDAMYAKKYVLYGGAAGPGKSYWLRWAALHYLIQCASAGFLHVHVGMFAEDYPSLVDRQISKIRREFPPELGEVRRTDTEGLAFQLKEEYGGGVISLRNLDDSAKYACYHPDTEILVRGKGFVPVAGVTVGDECFSMNPATRRMEWQPVTQTHEYDYDGDLLEFYSRFGPSYCVTPNHNMLYRGERTTQLRFCEAKNLPVDNRIPRVGVWGAPDSPEDVKFLAGRREEKRLRFSLNDYLFFLGLYVAEGSCDRGRWSINIAQHNGKNHDVISALLNRLGVNWNYDGERYSFNNKALVQHLKETTGGLARDKCVSQLLKDLPEDRLQHLFDGLVLGDGSRYKNGHVVYATTSPRLRDDVSEIALKLGYVPTCYTYPSGEKKYPSGRTYCYRESYHLSLTKRNKDTRCQRPASFPYTGKVYCPTVPPHHTVLIRYRGRTMFCGQSAEWAGIFVDELTKNVKQVFDDLRFRLRWPGLEHTVFCAASNPGSVGHGWVKKLWVDRDFSGDDANFNPEDFAFVRALPRDNPYLTQSYWEVLDSLPEAMRRALRDGDWNIFSGQVFGEFSHLVHVKRPFPIPQHWTRWAGLDYGYEDPTVCLWLARAPRGETIEIPGEDPMILTEHHTMAYREFAVKHMLAQDQARNIKSLSVREHLSGIFADPSMWAHRGQGDGLSVADEYQAVGVNLTKANNNRLAGWGRVHRALDHRPSSPPELWIFDNCDGLIRTLPNLPADPIRPEDVDTDSDDHWADACLVGETRVLTDVGERRLDSILAGDLVMTRFGLRRVLSSGETRKNAEVLRVQLSNGRSLWGTPDHRVLVDKEWRSLDSLRYGDRPIELTTTQEQQTVSLTEAMRSIVICGVQRTERFLKDFTFTLLMRTRLTTPLRILSASLYESTLGDILKLALLSVLSRCGSRWKTFVPWLQRGIKRMQAEHVVEETGTLLGSTDQQHSRFASSVGKPTNVSRTWALPSTAVFVAMLVSPLGVGHRDATTRRGPASFAERFLRRIATPVRRPAPVSVLGISPGGITNVFNLEVEDQPEYFAEGVLVHNCRYGLLAADPTTAAQRQLGQRTGKWRLTSHAPRPLLQSPR